MVFCKHLRISDERANHVDRKRKWSWRKNFVTTTIINIFDTNFAMQKVITLILKKNAVGIKFTMYIEIVPISNPLHS